MQQRCVTHSRVDIASSDIGEPAIDRKRKRITRVIKATATFDPALCNADDIIRIVLKTDLALPDGTYIVDDIQILREASFQASLLLYVSRSMVLSPV